MITNKTQKIMILAPTKMFKKINFLITIQNINFFKIKIMRMIVLPNSNYIFIFKNKNLFCYLLLLNTIKI